MLLTTIEKTVFNTLCKYFRSCSQLNLSASGATARIFVVTLVHYLIVQEMLQDRDILPMERDRLVEKLVKSDRCELNEKDLRQMNADLQGCI